MSLLNQWNYVWHVNWNPSPVRTDPATRSILPASYPAIQANAAIASSRREASTDCPSQHASRLLIEVHDVRVHDIGGAGLMCLLYLQNTKDPSLSYFDDVNTMLCIGPISRHGGMFVLADGDWIDHLGPQSQIGCYFAENTNVCIDLLCTKSPVQPLPCPAMSIMKRICPTRDR